MRRQAFEGHPLTMLMVGYWQARERRHRKPELLREDIATLTAELKRLRAKLKELEAKDETAG